MHKWPNWDKWDGMSQDIPMQVHEQLWLKRWDIVENKSELHMLHRITFKNPLILFWYIHEYCWTQEQLEVFIEHIPRANVYGVECYNYSSSADSATPRDWLHHINTPCIEHVVSGPVAGRRKNAAGPKTTQHGAIENSLNVLTMEMSVHIDNQLFKVIII